MKRIFLFAFLISRLASGSGACSAGGSGAAVWGSITGTLSAQTDLNTALGLKAPLDSPTFTTQAIFGYGTVSTVPYLDASKKLISSAVTPTQLGYLSGVTSALQTQLDAKAPLASPIFTGVVGTAEGTNLAPSIAIGDPANQTGFYTSGADTQIQATCGGTPCSQLNVNQMGMPGFLYMNVRGSAAQDNVITTNSTTDKITVAGDYFGDRTRGGWIRMGSRTSDIGEVWQLGNVSAVTLSGDATGQVYAPLLENTSSAQTGTVCSGTAGKLTVDTTVACLASTRKIKKNIELLDTGLGIVMRLQPVAYDLKEERAHEGRQVGLIAEEVAEVDKRLVAMDGEGEPRAVRYQQLTAVLVKAIQEQQAQITELRLEVQSLREGLCQK